MKKYLFTGLILSLSFASNAQPGMQIGWNVANTNYRINGAREDRSAVFCLNAGFVYRRAILSKCVLEPSLLYSRKGSRGLVTYSPGLFASEYYQTRLDYVQLSIPVFYRLFLSKDHSVDVVLGGGPFISCLAHASERIHYLDGENQKTDYSIGTSSTNNFKPLEAGLRLAGGFRFGRSLLSLSYDFGLTNTSPQPSTSILTRTFAVNLAILR